MSGPEDFRKDSYMVFFVESAFAINLSQLSFANGILFRRRIKYIHQK